MSHIYEIFNNQLVFLEVFSRPLSLRLRRAIMFCIIYCYEFSNIGLPVALEVDGLKIKLKDRGVLFGNNMLCLEVFYGCSDYCERYKNL